MSDTCHSCHHSSSGKQEALTALMLNAFVSLLELIGGVLSGSVAILSDAFNNTADTVGLGITYFALGKMEQAATERETFGGKRWEIIAALIKGGFLVATGIFIVYEGILRFLHPEPINTMLVLGLAVIALIVNLSSVFLLRKKAESDLNFHSTNLCMIYDAAASVAVIISTLLAFIFPVFALYFDLAAAILIVVLMIKSGIETIQQSINILLQNTPEEVDFNAVVEEIEKVSAIKKVYDVHIWKLASGSNHLTCHILLAEQDYCNCAEVLAEVTALLKAKFKITHTTIEPIYEDNGQSILCKAC